MTPNGEDPAVGVFAFNGKLLDQNVLSRLVLVALSKQPLMDRGLTTMDAGCV